MKVSAGDLCTVEKRFNLYRVSAFDDVTPQYDHFVEVCDLLLVVKVYRHPKLSDRGDVRCNVLTPHGEVWTTSKRMLELFCERLSAVPDKQCAL